MWLVVTGFTRVVVIPAIGIMRAIQTEKPEKPMQQITGQGQH